MSDALFERLAADAERESLHLHEDRAQRYDQPVEARVAAGLAIEGLRWVRTDRRPDAGAVYVFSAPRNESRLRPGQRARLSRGDPRRPAAHVEILDDSFDGVRYLLRLLVVDLREGERLEGGDPWVLDEDHFDLLDLELAMLRRASEGGLGRWLEGDEPRELAAPEAGLCGSVYGRGLAGSMAAAFEEVSRARNWHAVQGPPGTGKTFLLARLALDAAARQGLRVLVTAVSHQAIHNALEQCYWLAAESERKDPAARELARAGFFKLGSSKALVAGLPAGIRPARRLPRRRALIAGSTLYAVYAAAEPQSFDVVLFDESGQARLPLALGARAAAKRAVFIGDDSQLPPVAPASDGPGGPPPKSVLGMVRERYGAPLMLTETRRLNAELCAAVSDCFYDGRLSPTAEAAPRKLSLARAPRPALAPFLDPDASLCFVDVPHEGKRAVAEPEARWAAALAAEAMRCGVAGRDVGVVSPFRAQCNRIRFLLQTAVGAEAQVSDVLVSTAERFQGQERELILVSLAASAPRYLAALGGFLLSPNRLNVAISRARTKVVVLGALGVLRRFAEQADPDQEGAAGCRAFLSLLGRARVIHVDGEAPGVAIG
ncbi:MAG: ATP-binding protein [Elusimicrobia bacterium]|nr:ATP-binding protein [Elusimicrobiota bacterium]